MKTFAKNFLFLLMISPLIFKAQENSKKSITVLNIDSKGVALDPVQMGNLVRIELEKLDTFQVMDRYDVVYVVEKNKLNISNCYGKLCLVEIGSTIKSEKMFSGSVELYGETIIITFRLVDVATASIEKTQVMEFLNLPKEMQSMISITMNELFGRKNNPELVTKLTKKFNYESLTNNPNQERLNLSGPRMGMTIFTGKVAEILQESRRTGGYDAIPVMFQFGYQFEKQYLNEGNFQALFEFIPVITGLDQGLVIPGLTVMNGLRSNKSGWEFAFGPTFSIVKKSNGYYLDGVWHRINEWSDPTPNPHEIEKRLDSRGNGEVSSGFVFAFGKTFKSGKLNIPVNGYVIPAKDGVRFGASFGFNAKNRPSY